MSTRRKPRGSECQCVTCGEFFTGESAWQRHLLRVGCQPPGEVRDKHGNPALMVYGRSGGPTWGGVGSFDGYGATSGDEIPGRKPGPVGGDSGAAL